MTTKSINWKSSLHVSSPKNPQHPHCSNPFLYSPVLYLPLSRVRKEYLTPTLWPRRSWVHRSHDGSCKCYDWSRFSKDNPGIRGCLEKKVTLSDTLSEDVTCAFSTIQEVSLFCPCSPYYLPGFALLENMDLGKHKEIANILGPFAKGRYGNYDKGTKKTHRSRINGDVSAFCPPVVMGNTEVLQDIWKQRQRHTLSQ